MQMTVQKVVTIKQKLWLYEQLQTVRQARVILSSFLCYVIAMGQMFMLKSCMFQEMRAKISNAYSILRLNSATGTDAAGSDAGDDANDNDDDDAETFDTDEHRQHMLHHVADTRHRTVRSLPLCLRLFPTGWPQVLESSWKQKWTLSRPWKVLENYIGS